MMTLTGFHPTFLVGCFLLHKIKLWQIINNEMQGMKENIATKDDLAKTNQSIVRLKDKMDIN